MNRLARFLGKLPFSLDVGGRKTRLVLALGDRLIPAHRRSHFFHHDIEIRLPEHHLLRLWNYAPDNINRTYEGSPLWRFVSAHTPDKAVFIDIGANIGGYLYEAMLLDLESIGFEPNPELGPQLAAHPEMFGEVHTVALSDRQGALPFHISDANPGGSSLVTSSKGWEASGYDRTVEVPVTTFDAFFADRLPNWDAVHMVKIDVEGAEECVVRGMAQSLATGKIQAVWCEVRGPGSDRNPNSAAAVTSLMAQHGYNAYHYRPLEPTEFVPFDPDQDQPQFFDLLYVRSLPES